MNNKGFGIVEVAAWIIVLGMFARVSKALLSADARDKGVHAEIASVPSPTPTPMP